MRMLLLVSCILIGSWDRALAQEELELFQKAKTYYEAFEYEKAIPLLYECHRADEDNADYLYMLAFSNHKILRNDQGLIFLNAAIQKDSSNLNWYSLKATLLKSLRKYEEAFQVYENMIFRDSTLVHPIRESAKLLQIAGDTEAAYERFYKVLDLSPNDILSIRKLAYLNLYYDRTEEAESLVEHGLRIAPSLPDMLDIALVVYYDLKNFEEVISVGERLAKLGVMSISTTLKYAYAHKELGNLDEAKSILKARVNDNSEFIYYYLADIYLQQDSLELSQNFFHKAVEVGVTPRLSTYFKNIAHIEYKKGDLKQAIQYTKRAISWNDHDAGLIYQLALLYDNYYEDKMVAIKYYERYLETQDTFNRDYCINRIKYLKGINHQKGTKNE